MGAKSNATQFAVWGLGRFGMSVVQTLAAYDVNILACDSDPERLREAAEYATHVVQADAADEDAMEKLGIGNFDVVVMAMGEDFEASLLGTMKAKELGAKYIVAKAIGKRQKKILESIGADLVILPEHEMGMKTARKLVEPNILDVLEDAGHYRISEMRPMEEWVGKTVRESDIRKKEGVTLLAVLRGSRTIMPVLGDEVLQPDDIVIALAEPRNTT